MKNFKLAVFEKHIIRELIIIGVIQILLIGLFAYLVVDDIQDYIRYENRKTEEFTVFVEKLGYRYGLGRGNNSLFVFSGGILFEFEHLGSSGEPTARELEELISVGDKLELICKKSDSVFYNDPTYIVLDARTESEVYRSMDKMGDSVNTSLWGKVILFFIFEPLLIGYGIIAIVNNRTYLKKMIIRAKKYKSKVK